MNADWVAVTVRARSLGRRRVGAGGCRQIAAQPGLAEALALLGPTTYAERLAAVRPTPGSLAPSGLSPSGLAPSSDLATGADLAAAQRATHETVLWRLRVLAGWMPATGAQLFRAMAAAYERDNIVALAHHLEDGRAAPEPFDLGTLATAWSSVRTATSVPELHDALRRSPWGGPAWGAFDDDGAAGLSDVLSLVWLRRLASAAPAARSWAETAAALVAARILLVDDAVDAVGTRASGPAQGSGPVAPSALMSQLLRPLIGRGWESARTVDELRGALSRSARAAFGEVDGPRDLWRAEARLWVSVETDGFRLLRGALPGPEVVVGAVAVLAADAWRVRAALAAAAVGAGTSEVLDAVA